MLRARAASGPGAGAAGSISRQPPLAATAVLVHVRALGGGD
jgi:hypothetical protein